MKTLLTILLSILSVTLMAQVPQGVGYQGVATDSEGIELVNQAISIRAGVLSGSATGTIEWEETHSTTTDTFGLFTLTIGQGTNTTNGLQTSFADISWGTNTHFLKIEMDVTGGSTYSNMGTNQMMSVPYALYAETSGNPGNPGPQGEQGPAGLDGEDAVLNYDTLAQYLSIDSSFVSTVTSNIGGGGCAFGDFTQVNVVFDDGPIDYSYFIEALTDQFILAYVPTGILSQPSIQVWTDTTSAQLDPSGYVFSIGAQLGVYTIPVKKGQFWRASSQYAFNIVGIIPFDCGGGGGSSEGDVGGSNSSDIYLECVDMGVSVMCAGLGLDPSATLSSSNNYAYELSNQSGLNSNNYINKPHWRKFEIVGLSNYLASGGELMFKCKYTGTSQINIYPQMEFITPEINNENVYFYFIATEGTTGNCVNEENIGMSIPLSNSLVVLNSSTWGTSGSNQSNSRNLFEIFYESDHGYKSTGIIFDIN
jgi:hypothetical protein